MAMPPRPQPSRLHIPPHLASSPLDAPAMFSPGLPTAIHQGFPGYAHSAMQTPMQGSFFPPPMPGRPPMHRARSSVAHLANAGIFPPAGIPFTPAGVPLTPLGPGIPGMSAPFFPPGPGSFVPKSRRTMSIGGPPKAVLGGPNKQQSAAPPAPAPPPIKQKKVVVSLPKETVPGAEGEPSTRPEWAREPLVDPPQQPEVPGPELATADERDSDALRYSLPDTVEVYLPGKKAWDKIKHQIIEEKLEKLGVERGSGSTVPHIHAPHARAASISSPADPALLLFRLNKLHASQHGSPMTSLTTSPQPPLSLSISPGNGIAARAQNGRHGYSMSLAQPPSHSPANAFNPFGPYATLGSEQVLPAPEIADGPTDFLHTPQARAPIIPSSLAPPLGSRPVSRPDFSRGFGLDIPEEDEEAEAAAETEQKQDAAPVVAASPPLREASIPAVDAPNGADGGLIEAHGENEDGGLTTISHSPAHSRHVSRLSAALSLREVGGPHGALVRGSRSPDGEVEVENLNEDGSDVASEWTGSEDLRADAESSADESIGEWSNPSDEERARQERAHRRALRRARQEMPRRIPNFPHPPRNALDFSGTVRDDDDDDVVSNPSDEEQPPRSAHYLRVDHFSPGNGRPLPPLPHSRTTSANYSYYDPALVHSRQASEQISYPASSGAAPALNPNAKPFTLESSRFSGSFTSSTFGEPPTRIPSAIGHSRTPSAPKTLNVSAPVFTPSGIQPSAPVFTPARSNPAASAFTPGALKATAPPFTPGALKPDAPVFTPSGLGVKASAFTPDGFTFQPPVGVPQLSFPSPKTSRPLPTPPETVGPVRASQGREKRQRRSSETDVAAEGDDDELAHDSMVSFKFPSPERSKHIPRRSGSEPTSPIMGHSRQASSLNASAKPFSSSNFTATWPRDAPASESANFGEIIASPATQEVVSLNSDEESALFSLPAPPQHKPKRAPIPLDFTHPVSTKTVPAGLFKALSNAVAEDSARRSMRSRLDSGETFEHSAQPSLDDLNVVPISVSRKPARMVTDPGLLHMAQERDGTDRTLARLRAASMPGAAHSPASSVSEVSIPSMQFGDRVPMRGFEQRLEDLLENKMGALREDLLEQQSHTFGGAGVPATLTEAAVAEVVALIHTQLQKLVAKALEDNRLDSRGEFDLKFVKDIVEQGHEASRAAMKGDLAQIVQSVEARTAGPAAVSAAALEDISNRTVSAITQLTSMLTDRLNHLSNAAASARGERSAVVSDVVSNLLPHLTSLRAEAVDYDGLTDKLSQAVKPHITQLIDLASDKRETAGLIVGQLKPLLSPIIQAHLPLDTDALVSQLTAEVRKVVAPVDVHEIKEQVSDLVVERLDSRLAVRDRGFSVDTVVARITESMGTVMGPVQAVATAVERVSAEQHMLSSDTRGLVSSTAHISDVLDSIPSKLASATETLKAVQAELQSKASQGDGSAAAVKSITEVTSAIKDVHNAQRTLNDQVSDLVTLQQDVISGLNALPEVLVATTKVLDGAHEDMMTRERLYERDLNEVRHLLTTNAELQVNLTKARSQHGQVRVEKDMLNERLVAVEAERDRLRAQLDTELIAASNRAASLAATEARNGELERSLASAEERLSVVDGKVVSHQRDLTTWVAQQEEWHEERNRLQSTIKELELRSELALRGKENAETAAALVRAENERLVANSSHLDVLHRLSEQFESFQAQRSQTDNDELAELRRAKEKTESEFAALQKRFKEQEARIANSERTAYTARQTLAQAQQRASEWEKKATQFESERAASRSRAEEAESARAQFEADLTDTQSRLEEKDAHDRLARDRESKLRDQVAALEGQLAKLQVATAKPGGVPTLNGNSVMRNGRGTTASAARGRAASPSSTVYGRSRSTTPVRGAPAVEREGSVWDSMHAPKTRYPPTLGVAASHPLAIKAPASHQSHRATSPAQSVISVAPTLGEDGWWE